jgi:hypothetical protein
MSELVNEMFLEQNNNVHRQIAKSDFSRKRLLYYTSRAYIQTTNGEKLRGLTFMRVQY